MVYKYISLSTHSAETSNLELSEHVQLTGLVPCSYQYTYNKIINIIITSE